MAEEKKDGLASLVSDIASDEVKSDIDMVIKASGLSESLRFNCYKYWEEESLENRFCEKILAGKPRLESVAEHSWHLSDMVLLIAPRFPLLDVMRCAALAILHDKLELWTNDISPLGQDGTGKSTFAFNDAKAKRKFKNELSAAERYLEKLGHQTRLLQEPLIREILEDETVEAKFVRAMDKLQVYVFLLRRKRGDMRDEHIAFNIRYSRKYVDRVPFLTPYLKELKERLINEVAAFRRVDVGELEKAINMLVDEPEQHVLPLQ